MGLDNFWVSEDRQPARVNGEWCVCGGMCSGHGNDSFRGKVYDSLVEAASGYSLYREYIDPATVRLIADSLSTMTYEEAKTHTDRLCEDEYRSLKAMFRAHADAGHALTRWL